MKVLLKFLHALQRFGYPIDYMNPRKETEVSGSATKKRDVHTPGPASGSENAQGDPQRGVWGKKNKIEGNEQRKNNDMVEGLARSASEGQPLVRI